MIPSVEMPDPKLTSDTPKGNRRTIGKWFKIVTTKRSHSRTPCQTPPLQTKATLPKEGPSTMAPGKRQAVSVPSSVDTGYGYLTARLSGQFTVVDQRPVHAVYPIMNIITYRAPQEKKPPKTTPHSGAGSSNVPDATKAEPSGARNNVEVRVHFARSAAGTDNNSCSQKLGDHRRTSLGLPLQWRYPHGCVVAVQTITLERIERTTPTCGQQSPCLLWAFPPPATSRFVETSCVGKIPSLQELPS